MFIDIFTLCSGTAKIFSAIGYTFAHHLAHTHIIAPLAVTEGLAELLVTLSGCP